MDEKNKNYLSKTCRILIAVLAVILAYLIVNSVNLSSLFQKPGKALQLNRRSAYHPAFHLPDSRFGCDLDNGKGKRTNVIFICNLSDGENQR